MLMFNGMLLYHMHNCSKTTIFNVHIYILSTNFILTPMSPTLDRTWKQLTFKQTEVLKKYFQTKQYLEPKDRHELAKSINVSEKRIGQWFYRQWSITRKDELLTTSAGEECLVKHGINNTIFSHKHTCTNVLTCKSMPSHVMHTQHALHPTQIHAHRFRQTHAHKPMHAQCTQANTHMHTCAPTKWWSAAISLEITI